MEISTARKLVQATCEFYEKQCESFSETRQSPWNGWDELLHHMDGLPRSIDLLDLGCGNMRFEEFLEGALANHELCAHAFDSCEPLAGKAAGRFKRCFHHLDIIKELEAEDLVTQLASVCPQCDLSVAFGFMHHVPLAEWRDDLISALVQMTKPGGIICATFWQLRNSEKLLSKARISTSRGCRKLGIELSPDSGDYLLGWKDDTTSFRYVHDFSEDEISQITDRACKVGAHLRASFEADGKSGDLNRYIVLERDVD